MRTLWSTALAIGLDNARHDSDDDADHSRAGDEASGENAHVHPYREIIVRDVGS